MPCNGNHFSSLYYIIGRAKRSQTLGLFNRDFAWYIYMCRSVCLRETDTKILMPKCVGGTTRPKHVHAQSQFVAVGWASSFLEKHFFWKLQSQSKLNPNQIQIISNPYFALFSSSVSRANLSSVVATIFSTLAFLPLFISMANLSHLVAASFSSLALLSSSISTTKLSSLLATTFTSLSFLSNHHHASIFWEWPGVFFVVFRFWWPFIFHLYFFVAPSCSIFLCHILGLSLLCSSVSEALFALSFTFLSELFFSASFSSMLSCSSVYTAEMNNTGVTGQFYVMGTIFLVYW